jgi:hypothetical protein
VTRMSTSSTRRTRTMDRPYLEFNRTELDRLRVLIEHLTDEDLKRPLGDGWTISSALAHCAFWDRIALTHWQHWEQEGMKVYPVEVDVLNNALLPLWLAIPPREATRLVLSAAEEVDRKIEELSPDLADAYLTSGYSPWRIHTYDHRREHLDEIEHALSSKQ